MLIPRFTLRSLLVLMTASGLLFLVVAQAVRGRSWAIGISLAGAGLLLCFAVYAVLFSLAYVWASVLGLRRPPVGATSPFATMEPPAQMIAPEDPE